MKYNGRTGEYFEVLDISNENKDVVDGLKENHLSIIWFQEDDNHLVIDSKEYNFKKNQIIALTEFHNVEIKTLHSAKYLQFNKPFYCILDHDSEVGCKGILFFGSATLPAFIPSEEDTEILKTVWKMLIIEMKSKDNLQLEMLQMMLKRILILCTRIYKSQENYQAVETNQVDIIREFNFLVEQHFKEKHTVAEYASLLNKSPKTLSNLFGKLGSKSPLQLIQHRIILEVRRLLKYTEKPISEIGYEVGFSDSQSFSRFFKKNEGVTPTVFRNS